MSTFPDLAEFMPSQTLDPATIQTVIQTIRQVLPEGEIEDIVPVVGLGVSGEAQLFRFSHHNTHHPKPLVAKIGKNVGTNEQRGRKLLIEHLPLATAVESNQPDIFIYEFIPGFSLHDLLYERQPKAEFHLQTFVQDNLLMWQRTLVKSDLNGIVGYPTKLDSTLQLALNFPLGSQRLRDFADFPVIVNSKQVPSFNQCFQRILQLITPGDDLVISALQHGDEGAGNFIVRQDDGKHLFIDNGTAAPRLLAEGIAKIIMWWVVTAPGATTEFQVQENSLVFNYKLDLPQRIFNSVNVMIYYILKEFSGCLNYQQLAACLGIYCLREIQWAKKRGNNLSPALLAMAFDAFAGMSDGWLYFPGLDPT